MGKPDSMPENIMQRPPGETHSAFCKREKRERTRHIYGESIFIATENTNTDGTTVFMPRVSADVTDIAVLCGKASAQNKRYADNIMHAALLYRIFVIIFITVLIK